MDEKSIVDLVVWGERAETRRVGEAGDGEDRQGGGAEDNTRSASVRVGARAFLS